MSEDTGLCDMDKSTKPWIICSDTVRRPITKLSAMQFPEKLKKFCHVIWENEMTMDKDELSKVVALVVEGPRYYSKEFLSLFPNLKCVSVASRGYNHVDVTYLKDKGIAVGHLTDITSEPVSEFVFCLLLASAKQLTAGISSANYTMPTGGYVDYGLSICGKTLGIVGMGAIGSLVAKKASGFNMKIIYHNRRQRSVEDERYMSAAYRPTLSRLLQEADFVVLTLPLTPDTTKIIGQEQFRQMKSSATLINVSRGDVIDQDALVNALRTKQIRAAALDTTTPDPLPRGHPLLQMQNVIVTSHIAWTTAEAKEKVEDCTVNNLMAGIRGEPLPNPIP